ncbi:carboxypeptidase-like regulatory domain-containing protein [Pontibacter locisalis]|uniref:Carboxypeptidase-like regulatory domain-containing protein n=1 Tax=Pontibacter locisalis TaxID=1719035 RepID=A0ABW5IFM9_9BACT
MSQDNKQVLWAQGDHPSTELLRQYQENNLPPALDNQLEQHLLDCELCTDVVEGMVLSGGPETKAAVRNINRSVSSKIRKKEKRKPLPLYMLDWRVAAAILLVLCSMVLVLYYNYQELNKNKGGVASETGNTVDKSVNLANIPAAIAPEEMAEAVPDTVKQTITPEIPVPQTRIAAVTKPPQKEVNKVDFPEPAATAVPDEDGITFNFQADSSVAATAGALAKTAKPQTIILQKNTFVPESTSAVNALEGKLEGLQVIETRSFSLRQVQGRVLSPTGQPLPGVAVTVKGTNKGVATDAKGNFSLNLPKNDITLVFNYLGYDREEKAIPPDSKDITVNMKENTMSLSEVVVVRGVGTTVTKSPATTPAVPLTGDKNYKVYLKENIRYTSNIQKGRVILHATVSPTGNLQNLKVSKSLCPSCDQEALRLVREGPSWKAATKDGKPVAQKVKIVVRFHPPYQK